MPRGLMTMGKESYENDHECCHLVAMLFRNLSLGCGVVCIVCFVLFSHISILFRAV